MENKADLEPHGDSADNGLGTENLPAIVGEATVVPAFIADGGERAGFAFIDFFTAQVRNRNTRAAYAVAIRSFCAWCDAQRLTLGTLRTHHVAAYIEFLSRSYSPPSVKQHLAAIRMLFDWLVVRQVVEVTRPLRCAAPSTSSRKARPRCSMPMRLASSVLQAKSGFPQAQPYAGRMDQCHPGRRRRIYTRDGFGLIPTAEIPDSRRV